MDLYNWYVNLLSVMSICPIIKYMIANNESNWYISHPTEILDHVHDHQKQVKIWKKHTKYKSQ